MFHFFFYRFAVNPDPNKHWLKKLLILSMVHASNFHLTDFHVVIKNYDLDPISEFHILTGSVPDP